MLRIFISVVSVAVLSGQVVMNEIMYDLPGSDSPNEFIELLNLSSTETVNMANWEIRDRYSTDQLIDTITNYQLPPNGYAVILEGDYPPDSGLYTGLIPENTILLFVDDASIGNGLSSADSVYLLDPSGTVIDSVGWTDIAPDGYSLEKIRPWDANTSANWGISRDSLGTPGTENSLFPFLIDGILRLEALRDSVPPDSALTIQAMLFNDGLQPISGNLLLAAASGWSDNLSVPSIPAEDSLEFLVDVSGLMSGFTRIVGDFQVVGEQNPTDNADSLTVGVRFLPETFTLTEFLPAPVFPQIEFVEIQNRSESSFSLKQWSLRDSQNSAGSQLPDSIIRAGQLAVIAASGTLPIPDSSIYIIPAAGFPSLNNSADAIRLFDPFGTLIDSLYYDDSWGTTSGISLEKILPDLTSCDPEAWRICRDSTGMTPGRRNSVTPFPYDGALDHGSVVTIPAYPSPNTPFALNVIAYNDGLLTVTGTVRVDISNSPSLVSETLTILAGDSVTVTFWCPGLSSGYHTAVIVIDAANDQYPGNNEISTQLAVAYRSAALRINEFLAGPNNDQTEFIEIVASDSLSLRDWSFADSHSPSGSFPELTLEPGDYYVVAADSIILSFMPEAVPALILEGAFPTLNNSGDAIRIFDHTGFLIDSLAYDNTWPLQAEWSTEKVHPELESADRTFWALSSDPTGMTPGRPNSVTLLNCDGTILQEVGHSPRYPTGDDSIRVLARVTNAGRDPISGIITIETNDIELGQQEVPEAAWRDTLDVSIVIPPLPAGYNPLSLYYFVSGEEYSYDNLAYDTVAVSYPAGTARINEFLAIPDEFQCEFVEIYNPLNIDLRNWGLNGHVIGPPWFNGVTEKEYCVVAADSTLENSVPATADYCIPNTGFSGLSNSGDSIYLIDHTGCLIDSLRYTSGWPLERGRSTEKFRPEYDSNDSSRWAVAVNALGMTPGWQNSVYYDRLPVTGALVIAPNPFSPDNDGKDDRLAIHYSLPFEYGILRLEIFDILGRRLRTLAWDTPVNRENVITWDGKNHRGEICRMGIYLIKFDAAEPISGNHWEKLVSVVLAKK